MCFLFVMTLMLYILEQKSAVKTEALTRDDIPIDREKKTLREMTRNRLAFCLMTVTERDRSRLKERGTGL